MPLTVNIRKTTFSRDIYEQGVQAAMDRIAGAITASLLARGITLDAVDQAWLPELPLTKLCEFLILSATADRKALTGFLARNAVNPFERTEAHYFDGPDGEKDDDATGGQLRPCAEGDTVDG